MMSQWVHVKVHPSAGKEILMSLGPDRFEAWVRAKPVDGEANEAVTNLLARSLKLPPSRIRLIKGRSGRHKVFQINSQ